MIISGSPPILRICRSQFRPRIARITRIRLYYPCHPCYPWWIERGKIRKISGEPEVAITIVTRIEVLHGRFEFLRKAATGAELLRAQRYLDVTNHSLAAIQAVI